MSTDTYTDIVLVITGAFNPVHIGHLECVKVARAHLIKLGYRVKRVLFSPSHDQYVTQKMAKKHERMVLSGADRAELLKLALEGDADLRDIGAVDTMEMDMPATIGHVEVTRRIQQRYDESGERVKVVFVAGGDLATRMRGWKSHGAFPVAVVRRAGDAELAKADYNRHDFRFLIHNLEERTASASSTEVRRGSLDLVPEESRDAYERMLKTFAH